MDNRDLINRMPMTSNKELIEQQDTLANEALINGTLEEEGKILLVDLTPNKDKRATLLARKKALQQEIAKVDAELANLPE